MAHTIADLPTNINDSPLRAELQRWRDANPGTEIRGCSCFVTRGPDGKKAVRFPGSWLTADITEDDRWWSGNTLAIVTPADWVAVDIDQPGLAKDFLDVGGIKAASDCRYGTSVDDDGCR